jgi:molybdopterin synthase catalytic subunit
MPDVAKPPTPPNPPTLADARTSGVSLDQQARAAAAAGAVAGFSGTVKNKGGAQGIDLGTGSRARLAKASLY